MVKIERYPLVMHRGQFPEVQSKYVHNEAQEATARDEGFDTNARPVPPPPPEKPVLTVEDRLLALEDRVEELASKLAEHGEKRGPGRPKKGE